MLGNEELLAWFQSVRLPDNGRSIVRQIRSSDPSRRVGGGRRNVSGRYPSKKMGITIQFESHRVELARIYELEHDPNVLEYWDQPPSYKLEYKSSVGRRIVTVHTSDYFVIRTDGAGWEECKTEEELVRWSERSPHRYCRRGDIWYCPPGEEHAKAFGLTYCVRSSLDIDWVYQRNIQFLEDYLRDDRTSVAPTTKNLLIAHVNAHPGISLQQLLATAGSSANCDDIHLLIAFGELHVDLRSSLLAQPDSVAIFADARTAADHLQVRKVILKPSNDARAVQPRSGSVANWDGRQWEVVNCGRTRIILRRIDDDSIAQLPVAAFQSLVEGGHLTMEPSPSSCTNVEVEQRLSRASQADLQQANFRYEVVRKMLDGERATSETTVPSRTSRRWISMYRKAETLFGNGYLGLLPETQQKGNSTHKLPEASRQLMATIIHEDYETPKQKSMYASWCALQIACRDQVLIAPSYRTFRLAVRGQAGHSQTLRRMGPRAAYPRESFYWELELTTPRHGDRPFEIAHLDHTELDVELVCSATGRGLGRPWLSLLTDAYSRRVLAFTLSYDPPSYRSCMMIIRECVGRHERLPQIFVVDGGAEFGSVYFETLLARYECIKKTRPPAKARFGSVVERLFGTCNSQFIHNLRGNTQIMRQVRQVTASVNPKNHAVWALADLHEGLAKYLYEVYDSLDHPALGQSPGDAYETGMTNAGLRPRRRISNDREFFIMTLPTTPRGAAKVLAGRGVKIHYIYYWSDLFHDPEVEGRQVPVRYDPLNSGIAFAFVKDQWVQCHSEYYAVFQGHSEREMMLATQELRRRRHKHSSQRDLSAKTIGDFLQSVEVQELVLSQRLRDLQTGKTRSEPASVAESPLVNSSPSYVHPFLVAASPQIPVPDADEEYETYGAF
jgi:transposase InsO family protein